MSTDPIDDFRNLLNALPAARSVDPADGPDFEGRGQLGSFNRWLKIWSDSKSKAARPGIAIFAGAHGISSHGVDSRSDAQTVAFVQAAGDGSAAIAKLCAASNIGLKVLDLALEHPTGDISRQPALDPRGCAATIAFGMEAAAGGSDLLCISALGAGGDVAASALLAALSGGTAANWADTEAPVHFRMRQEALIEATLARLSTFEVRDGMTLICEVGGREIAALAGAITAARMERIPVLLDGIPALAAALALRSLKDDAIEHCLLAAAPQRGLAAKLAFEAGLGVVAGASLKGSPGMDGALAIQTVRLAAV